MKQVDKAGMWTLRDNPITHEGVFLYSGRVVDPSGRYGTDPDKFYSVYRPFEELKKACESFNGKPLINDHEMLGTEGGVTRPDEKNIGGSLFNVRPDPTRAGYIVADMTIFSDEVQSLVREGKKELSLGYFCNYEKREGDWNGQHYDFVQTELEGNHIALVDKGRMGSDCRVFDSADKQATKVFVYDSMEEIMNPKKMKKAMDADELRDAINAKLKEATDEQLSDIDKILADKKDGEDEGEEPEVTDEDEPEKKDGEDEETKTPDEDEKKDSEDEGEEEKSEDEDEDGVKDEDEPKKDGEDDEGCEDEEDDKKGKGEDSDEHFTRKMMKAFSAREKLYRSVEPFVGAFDHDEMTARDVARYAAKKMKVAVTDGAEVAIVEAYVAGRQEVRNERARAYDSDESRMVRPEKMTDAFKSYLGK